MADLGDGIVMPGIADAPGRMLQEGAAGRSLQQDGLEPGGQCGANLAQRQALYGIDRAGVVAGSLGKKSRPFPRPARSPTIVDEPGSSTDG